MGPFSQGWTEADVEAVIAKGNPLELIYVPIVVGMNAADCDRGWAENICCSLASHESFNVRGNAVLGLAHIARTCRSIDSERAVPIVKAAFEDESEFVRGHAIAAAEDFETYLGIIVEPPRT
ncbi:HEAT repeat domain-containing protein [Uliginosibacterium sp. TH139]|uniref:HEAT repeat domain-containing protein n=1 Tax=Uliginosibacterium sp. TH139 TaxID=2067453 RepID=UPI0011804A3C|nr:HEAT repeat domain-containing protein [Uliginosibacterium sp. TH139]